METFTEPVAIYPDAPDGVTWRPDMSRPINQDPWVVIGGDATYSIQNGVLRISGEIHRLYVRHPDRQRQWRNIEVTVYFQRVRDSNVAWSGMTAVARTDHGAVTNRNTAPCDTRGISARVRNDGATDFAKETLHPNWVAAARTMLWPNGLPMNRWIGFKYMVYDLDGGGVRQETWLDRDNNGQWEMVNAHNDFGGWWGRTPCAPGIDPTLPLTTDSRRPGSETGRPNVAVYFRADGVGTNGLLYRSMSIREIRVSTDPCSDDSAACVRIGEQAHPLAGLNVRREENDLVVYNSEHGPATTTNRWGVEAVVRCGIVVQVRDQRTAETLATPIPRDGVVLSGHGTAMNWLLANAQPGASVTLPPGFGSPGVDLAILDTLDTAVQKATDALQEATEALQEATEAASALRQAMTTDAPA